MRKAASRAGGAAADGGMEDMEEQERRVWQQAHSAG